ncbi:MAG: gliding motility-associated C-terminal domain-containing protein [Flavobacteriales bacterium]|nr:gliding motility-associated C-terminal domain-containing protein [Flavobacteriales bacterium]
MKKGLYILLLSVFFNKGYGQNLVQNGSFEDTITCATLIDNHLTHWKSINTVDWYSNCLGITDLWPELNSFNPTLPVSGSNIAGIGYAHNATIPDYYEILYQPLLAELEPAKFYCFSCWVKSGKIQGYISNFVQVYFSVIEIDSSVLLGGNLNPQVVHPNIVEDYINWTEIKGGFISDSALKIMYIGPISHQSIQTSPNPFSSDILLKDFSYYFLDEISLYKMNVPLFSSSFTCESGQFSASVSGADSVRWYRNGQLFSTQAGIVITNPEPGESLMAEYFLCNYTFTDTLTVPPCTVPEPEFPNIITPNGDGVNDAFTVEHLPPGSSLIIYNRWGNEVFRTAHYNNTWQGTTETFGIETKVSDGTYFYVLITQEGRQYKGTVTVVK